MFKLAFYFSIISYLYFLCFYLPGGMYVCVGGEGGFFISPVLAINIFCAFICGGWAFYLSCICYYSINIFCTLKKKNWVGGRGGSNFI